VLYSSGDFGVAGNGGQCQTANGVVNGAELNNGGEGNFNPSFPGTCPVCVFRVVLLYFRG